MTKQNNGFRGYWREYARRRIPLTYAKRMGLEDVKRGFRIPVRDIEGNILFRRKRHIPALVGDDGKERKFTQPLGQPNRFNFLPLLDGRSWADFLSKPEEATLVIAEGDFKGAAMAALGYATIATSSVFGHRTHDADDRSVLIEDVGCVPWSRLKRVLVIPDNDIHIKPSVQAGFIDLDKAIRDRGKVSQFRLLPYPLRDTQNDGAYIKLGVDDYLHDADDPKQAFRDLPKHTLDEQQFADWGEGRHRPPKSNVVADLTFSRLPLSVFTEKPPEREYVLTPWIGKGLLTFLVATGGMGKGWLVLSLAMHVATGHRWLGMVTQKCRVVLLCMEDPAEEINRRIHIIANEYVKAARLTKRERKRFFNDIRANVRYESLEGKQLHLIEQRDRGIVHTPELVALAQKLKPLRPGLLIPDPLSQLHSLNENANEIGSALISAVGYLRTELSTAVLIPAHTSKDADSRGRETMGGMRGASSLVFGGRSVVFAYVLDDKEAKSTFAVKDDDVITFARLTHVKNNYGPRYKTIYIMRGAEGDWKLHDPNEISFKTGPAYSVWIETLRESGLESFSKRQITQSRRVKVFGANCGRPVAEKHFRQAIEVGDIEEVAAASKLGGGKRYVLTNGK